MLSTQDKRLNRLGLWLAKVKKATSDSLGTVACEGQKATVRDSFAVVMILVELGTFLLTKAISPI